MSSHGLQGKTKNFGNRNNARGSEGKTQIAARLQFLITAPWSKPPNPTPKEIVNSNNVSAFFLLICRRSVAFSCLEVISGVSNLIFVFPYRVGSWSWQITDGAREREATQRLWGVLA